MPISSSDQLKEQIESIPVQLRKALDRQAKAFIAVARLESQRNKLEAELEGEDNEEGDEVEFEDDALEDDLQLLKLESTVERVKLRVAEAEDKAEMEYRAAIAKTTEGQVKAAVGTDVNVMKLRHQYLDAKEAHRERKLTLQRERQVAREAKLEAQRQVIPLPSLETEKLFTLKEKCREAEEEVVLANIEVEVVRATIETYKMLVQISS